MGILSNFQPSFLPVSLVRQRFIETGVYVEGTMTYAVQHKFKRLDGIEINPDRVQRCRTRFASDPRVKIHRGSSPDVLKRILEDVPTTLWLDAHFTGADRNLMDVQHGECPLLAELAIINAFSWTVKPIILIDDVFMFNNEFWKTPKAKNFDRRQWPQWERVKQAFIGYELLIRDDILYALAL